MGSHIQASLQALLDYLMALQNQCTSDLYITRCHSKPLPLEWVCNSRDFRVLALILSSQTILYQVQLLEACSLQIVIGFEGTEVEGTEVEDMEVEGAEVEGAVPEDVAINVMWMR